MKAQQNGQINQFRRYLWHFNRTPGAHVLKAALRLANMADISKRRHAALALPWNDGLDTLARSLNEKGYANLDSVIDAQRLAALNTAGEVKLASAGERTVQQRLTHKDFWTRLLDEDAVDGRLPTDSPFVAFALQPAVVGVLARALGEVPKLDYVLLTLSHYSDKPLSYSQLWHRDHDDPRTIKLFVYLTDVEGAADGPFTFIPRPASDRFGFSLRSHRPDRDILRKVAPNDIKVMIAPRLTTFLVETSRCLHMGSRLGAGHQRLLYTATFFRVPRIFPEPPSPFRIVGQPDAVTRLVLSQ